LQFEVSQQRSLSSSSLLKKAIFQDFQVSVSSLSLN
jgi:hypothetical protein